MHTSLKSNIRLVIAAVAAAMIMISCATMGETKIAASVDDTSLTQVVDLENRLPGLINRPDPNVRRNLEREVSKLLGTATYNQVVQARLWGILAETAWLYQDRPLLDQAVREMSRLDANQVRLIIARSRLAKPADRIAILQAALSANPDAPLGEIKLELALDFFAYQRFREASAAFDDAFTSLSPVWISLYKAKRDLAYRQKDQAATQNSRESLWLSQENVNRESLIGLALLRTPYLDRYGKSTQLGELNQKLENDQFLPASDPQSYVELASPQTRATAAWFLFHIALTQENRLDLLNGGKTWKTSPIPDVPLEDWAFRAILGVVQREILNLKDGSNFNPSDALSTGDYLKALEKLRMLYP